MKTQLKARPQSKGFKGQARPVSRLINKEQAVATFQQGKQEQNQKAYQKAIQLYLRASIYDPKYFQAYCNIGSCYRSLGQYMEACRYYKKSIAIKNDDAISHYNLANAQRLIGDYEESIFHYNFVIGLKQQKKEEIGSLYIDSLINVGICFKNKQLFDKANQCYQKALKINAKDESALFNYGMSIVRSLKAINGQLFQEVTKEKAEKATALFKKLLQVNKQSIIAEFQILRMSLLLDRSNENVNKVSQKLKKLLTTPKCTITEEINLELAYCLNLLKNYQQSSKQYNKSLNNFAPRKASAKNIYDNSGGFIDTSIPSNGKSITEDQGMKLLEDGQYQDLVSQIDKMPDVQMKHVLEMALQIALVQSGSGRGSIQKALEIYDKYFKKDGVDLPMDAISIQGHKVIGRLLSIQQEYKESIKHFQFISDKLNTQKQRSQLHSSLATDYEGLGDRTKAMTQIKLALSTQPDNFEFVYNAGCLYHEEGAYSEALPYFQKFLELFQKETHLQMGKRNLYLADCLVTMASCKNQLQTNKLGLYPLYERAWTSIKEVQSQASEDFQFDEQRLMNFYLQWADILELKLTETPDKRSQEFIRCKQRLLDAYMCLLQSQSCPDRDPILNNCASIYYQQKLYVNALANFNQISDESCISYNNLALTYLHLREHFMASKLIFKTAEEPTEDRIENFNREVISWIYGIQQEEQTKLPPLYSKFSNNSDQALLSRLEYGLLIIDAFSSKLSKLPQRYEYSQVQDIIKNLIKSDHLQEYYQQSQHPKLKILASQLKKVIAKKSDDVDLSLLQLCLVESENPQGQFSKLITMLGENDSLSQSASQILINLFIFINRKHSSSLRAVLQNFNRGNEQPVKLDLDRRVTITSDLTTRAFGTDLPIQRIEDLIVHFINWETELESKLVVLIKTVQKYYYKGKIRKPFQIQYNFPRHAEWDEETTTLLRIAYVILSGFKTEVKFVLKGKSLSQMKGWIFSQLQQGLIQQFDSKDKVVNVVLGDKFVPVTLYTYHESKKDCLLFLKELQKESSDKHEIQIGRESKELIVNVSSIMRLRCQWEQPNSFTNLIKSISEHPLPLEVQSTLGLQSELYILKQVNEKNRELLDKYEVFRG